MKKYFSKLIAMVLVAAMCVGCGTDISDHVCAAVKPDKDASDAKNLSEWVEKGKELSIKDFEKKSVAEFMTGDENKVYSPVNVYIALSMLAEACSGDTQKELFTLLGCDDIVKLRRKAQAMWNANYLDKEDATKIANSLWLNEDVRFKEDMLKKYAEEYHASTFFGKMGTSEMNKLLQDWVNENTGNLFQEEAGNLKTTPDTLVTILSTIFFNGKWKEEYKFDPNLTTDLPAFSGKSGIQRVPMMRNSFGKKNAYHTDEFTEFDMELTDGKICFFKPEKGVDPETILKDGSLIEALHKDDDGASPTGRTEYYDVVSVTIPKFEIHSDTDLIDSIKNLGVGRVFDPATADMKNLFTEEALKSHTPYVGQIRHDAKVKIDEEGVTAAAFTEIEVADGAAPVENVLEFTLDSPFIYAITGKDGSILFVGTVYDLK